MYFLWFIFANDLWRVNASPPLFCMRTIILVSKCWAVCNQSQVKSYPLLGSQFKTYGVHPLDSISLPQQFCRCMLGHNFIQSSSNSYISPNLSPQQDKDKKSRCCCNIIQGSHCLNCSRRSLLSWLDWAVSKQYNICILYPRDVVMY